MSYSFGNGGEAGRHSWTAWGCAGVFTASANQRSRRPPAPPCSSRKACPCRRNRSSSRPALEHTHSTRHTGTFVSRRAAHWARADRPATASSVRQELSGYCSSSAALGIAAQLCPRTRSAAASSRSQSMSISFMQRSRKIYSKKSSRS